MRVIGTRPAASAVSRALRLALLLCAVLAVGATAMLDAAQSQTARGAEGSAAPRAFIPLFEGVRDRLVAEFLADNCAALSFNEAAAAEQTAALRRFLDQTGATAEQIGPHLQEAPKTLFIEYWVRQGFTPEEVFLDTGDTEKLCAHGRDISTAGTSVGRLLTLE